jgi:hypothetical protein
VVSSESGLWLLSQARVTRAPSRLAHCPHREPPPLTLNTATTTISLSAHKQETARAELISVMPRPATRDILVLWRLEGRVNLPLKPAIKPYVVLTILGLNEQGLICSQVDEFTVPGWDLLLSTLLGHWLGAKPAPPVGELRAAAAAGQLVPQPRNEKK